MGVESMKDVKLIAEKNIKDMYGENISNFTINSIVDNSDRYDVSTEFDYAGFHYTVYLSIDDDGNVTKFNQIAKAKLE
ncbi:MULTISPECIES: hypothetical protein [Ferroplasma]|jgi:hypothetical protein|nr:MULTISPECIES: hypothetical protein [Ferroplasma]ARD85067.1 hypothetical protein FAD_1193 [Ferroplasma acidiphilum]MCL4349143.1 hypothetical protein [Candidatus Thermoplasmatota archaeon]NOL60458.1 hypothetical protein [Ferroplasma acidiphilum]WMT54007.1 MAG: hypothetical protein RE473_03940 [Ferroplasma acidiphilum]